MCVFCAAIPVTAAVGVKLNAEQLPNLKRVASRFPKLRVS